MGSNKRRDCVWWPATLDVSAGRVSSCQRGPALRFRGSTFLLSMMCVAQGQGIIVTYPCGVGNKQAAAACARAEYDTYQEQHCRVAEFPGADVRYIRRSIKGKKALVCDLCLATSPSVPDVLLWVRALHITLPGLAYACSDTRWPDARTESA